MKYGNPYQLWKTFNSPKLPTMNQIEEMRIAANPRLTINSTGGFNDNSVLNAPGLIMTHFVFALGTQEKKWNNPPAKIENVMITVKNASYSFNEDKNISYYISWDSLDSHIISTFVINYSQQKNGPYIINILTNNILNGYVWTTQIKTGYISVYAMDYWGLNGTVSNAVQLPAV